MFIKKQAGMTMGSEVWMIILVTMVVSVTLAMPAAAAKLKINIGSTYGPHVPAHFGQVKFKELVEQRSKDEMKVLMTSAICGKSKAFMFRLINQEILK